MTNDIFGGLIQVLVGTILVWRRGVFLWWVGVLMIAVGLWLLWPSIAGACDVHGYWTVSQEGDSSHELGQNSVEINRPTTPGGFDSVGIKLNLDPNADWSGCGVINYVFNASVGLNAVFGGVPQAAAWSSSGGVVQQTGGVGEQSGVFLGSLTGPAEVEAGGWLNGAATGFVHFSLTSQWTVAPERMSPLAKRRIRSSIRALNVIGDATALSAGAIALAGPDGALAAGLLGLNSGFMKATSNYLKSTLDADPWDSSYRRVFRPIVPPVPAFVKGAIFRSWSSNAIRIRETSRALFVAVNRANTAMAMEDAPAEDRQQGRIDVLLRQLGRLFVREADFRVAVGAKLAAYDTPVDDAELVEELRATGAALLR